jgi:C1A family cysteine protease
MSSRGMGWIPDVPKPSDYTPSHAKVAPLLERTPVGRFVGREKGAMAREVSTIGLQPRADLRQWFSAIEDQGHLGSCTANAAVGLVEYFERRAKGKFIDASRLFVYKTSRELLGLVGDTGAYLRTAMEALALFGAPPEQYWPYDGSPADSNTRYELEPTAFCYAFAENYKAIRYFRLDPDGRPAVEALDNVKRFLAAGFPSMFGFPVYSEYDYPQDGLVAFPSPSSQYRGGHANIAVGYDDDLMIGQDRGALLVRNSWGTGWGLNGYAWLSYRYVTEGLAVDWWSLISANWIDAGIFTI